MRKNKIGTIGTVPSEISLLKFLIHKLQMECDSVIMMLNNLSN